ncbi:hypothetical protein IFR05_016337 [Cadophora sp. M221]|nr:hypothetical protein IFR05_016337 [Cadophora sp. M221]
MRSFGQGSGSRRDARSSGESGYEGSGRHQDMPSGRGRDMLSLEAVSASDEPVLPSFTLTVNDLNNFTLIPPSNQVSTRSQSEPAITVPPVRQRQLSAGLETIRSDAIHNAIPNTIHNTIQLLNTIPSLPRTSLINRFGNYLAESMKDILNNLGQLKQTSRDYLITSWERILSPLNFILYWVEYFFVNLTAAMIKFIMGIFFYILPYMVLFYVVLFAIYGSVLSLRESTKNNTMASYVAFFVYTPVSMVICVVPGVEHVDRKFGDSLCSSGTEQLTFNYDAEGNQHQPPPRPSSSQSKAKPLEDKKILHEFQQLISPIFWEESLALALAQGLRDSGNALRAARSLYANLYNTWKWTIDPELLERRQPILGPLDIVATSLDAEAMSLILFHSRVIFTFLNVHATLGYFRDKVDKLQKAQAEAEKSFWGRWGNDPARETLMHDYTYLATQIIKSIDELVTYIDGTMVLNEKTQLALEHLQEKFSVLKADRVNEERKWEEQSWWTKYWNKEVKEASWWSEKGKEKTAREMEGVIRGNIEMMDKLLEIRILLTDKKEHWDLFKGILNTATGIGSSSSNDTTEYTPRDKVNFMMHFEAVDRYWTDYKGRATEAYKRDLKGKRVWEEIDAKKAKKGN